MINGVVMKINADELILQALKEDMPNGDITTNAIMPEAKTGSAKLICKQDGVIAGLPVFKRVFELLDDTSSFQANFQDGDAIKTGDVLGILTGDIRAILSGERTALNFLQRMSGIATLTASLVKELAGSPTKLLDTRKTTPNMRIFEKYAVVAGGGTNHRTNLSDGILIKDNHIGAAGGIKEAVTRVRAFVPFGREIEVEVENLAGVKEALAAGADIIMLDNMADADIATAVKLIQGQAKSECSGNVNRERLQKLASLGVDYISMGALTHSAPILDLSLKHLKAV